MTLRQEKIKAEAVKLLVDAGCTLVRWTIDKGPTCDSALTLHAKPPGRKLVAISICVDGLSEALMTAGLSHCREAAASFARDLDPGRAWR